MSAFYFTYQLYKKDHWEDSIAKECYKKLEELISKCQSAELQMAKHAFAAFVINRGGNLIFCHKQGK